MKITTKLLIPVAIIILTVLIIKTILDNPPKVDKKDEAKNSKIAVETMELKSQIFQPMIESYGLVEAYIRTDIISQVSGKVVHLNKNFQNGASFKKGELLVMIEDLDYKANVKIAQAKHILAKQELLEEQALSNQAKEEWENLNTSLTVNNLVLRVPQLNFAKANLLASEAELEKAKLELQRTKIYAPYNGRIMKKNIEITEVISTNAVLASIYASKNIQIRLPIKNKDLNLLDLNAKSKVNFYSSLSSDVYKGKILRSEGSIDLDSGQLYLIAKINSHKNIKIGEYLKAKIDGKSLKKSLVIPNRAIYQGSYLYIEKDGFITRRDIKLLYKGTHNSLISQGVQEKENIVLTNLGVINSGASVKVINKVGGIEE